MSNAHITAALAARDLSPAQKLVLFALCNRADELTGECWPTISTLQEETALSRQSVLDQIKALEEKRILSVLRASCRSGGKRMNNRYRIRIFFEDGDLRKPRIQRVDSPDQTAQRMDQSRPSTKPPGIPVDQDPSSHSTKLVHGIDQNRSTTLTKLADDLGQDRSTTLTHLVNDIDQGWSTTLTRPVNVLDCKPHKPSLEPKEKPTASLPEPQAASGATYSEFFHLRPESEAPQKRGADPSDKSTKPAKSAHSERAFQFADWFHELLPDNGYKANLPAKYRQDWAQCFDELVKFDHRDPDEIFTVCEWARKDDFWSRNFLSPAKLRQRDKSKTKYFDVLVAHMAPATAPTPAVASHAATPAAAEPLPDPPRWREYLAENRWPYRAYAKAASIHSEFRLWLANPAP